VGQRQDECCFTEFGCDTTGGEFPPVSSGQALIAVATPPPVCSLIAVNGVIDSSDPTQTGRVVRNGVPSACCEEPKVCPGPFDALQHHYDSYTFTNTSGATQCVTVDINTACTGNNVIFATAYLGSFNPIDVCANYLADEGVSPLPTQPFSFNVDDGQTIVIVVVEVNSNAGCSGYTMTATTSCPETATPSPTPTATATATATAQRRLPHSYSYRHSYSNANFVTTSNAYDPAEAYTDPAAATDAPASPVVRSLSGK